MFWQKYKYLFCWKEELGVLSNILKWLTCLMLGEKQWDNKLKILFQKNSWNFSIQGFSREVSHLKKKAQLTSFLLNQGIFLFVVICIINEMCSIWISSTGRCHIYVSGNSDALICGAWSGLSSFWVCSWHFNQFLTFFYVLVFFSVAKCHPIFCKSNCELPDPLRRESHWGTYCLHN